MQDAFMEINDDPSFNALTMLLTGKKNKTDKWFMQ